MLRRDRRDLSDKIGAKQGPITPLIYRYVMYYQIHMTAIISASYPQLTEQAQSRTTYYQQAFYKPQYYTRMKSYHSMINFIHMTYLYLYIQITSNYNIPILHLVLL